LHKLFQLFFLALLLSSCQSNSCEDFKIGQFIYPKEMNSDVVIERTAEFQIETSKKDGYTDKYQIIWDSDCSYHLVLLETNNEFDGMKPLTDTMHVNMVEVLESSYKFKAVLNSKVFEGQLIKQ
jgi:hypothetical protein